MRPLFLAAFVSAATLVLGAPAPPLLAADIADTRARLAELESKSRYVEAIAVARQLQARLEKELGAKHVSVARLMNRRAEFYRRYGDPKRAETIYETVVERFAETAGRDREVVQTALGNLVLIYMSNGEFARAEAASQRMKQEAKRAAGSGIAASAKGTHRIGEAGNRSAGAKGEVADPDSMTAGDGGAVRERQTVSLQAAPASRPTQPKPAAEPCGAVDVSTKARPYGAVTLRLRSPCRANQRVTVAYGSVSFARRFDAQGAVKIELDLFAGEKQGAALKLEDGANQKLQFPDVSLKGLSKVAVIWSAPVDLDLHAFEYAAAHGAGGHIWSGNRLDFDTVKSRVDLDKRGHGFLSLADDGGSTTGSKAEVYTFLHADGQRYGAVALALDFKARGDVPQGAYCGAGASAEVRFQVVILDRKGGVSIENGLIPSAPCGKSLAKQARYLWSAVPDLRIRR